MLELIEQKILTLPQAQARIAEWRSEGKRVVWTNGVFDLLHPGHIRYLCAARKLGDLLIVGINSDASVKRLKGEGRPINPEGNRLLQVAAMQMVDLVMLFDEDTPLKSIVALKPDIITKGGDYLASQVVGGEEARVWGGRVKILPFENGYSSSGIIEKIKGTGDDH
ncbi:MAG: D-glycero-beta-D-manno-heptose 1-phosphate adenylyltransferase [Saprospiraceae bacterium]|nr:D-glycero-beta-D-manno-heptose 1-phosphate adenylyltransferase [Saprospiraceae bacterium]